MKILLDQGLPRSTTSVLRASGHDSTHVGDIGLARASDESILDRGRADGSVIVTLDADFHALLAFSGAAKPSVIRIRIEGLSGAQLAASVLRVIDACASDLEAGAVVSVLPDRLRLRRLPLKRSRRHA